MHGLVEPGIILSATDATILLVSGTTSDGISVTCGAFTPVPANKTTFKSPPQYEPFLEGNTILQLEPVHNVCRAPPELTAWACDENDLWFGDREHGVTLLLSENLTKGRFVHCLDDEAVWVGDPRRGTFEVEFKVRAVELMVQCADVE